MWGSEPIELRFDEPASGSTDVALTADTIFSQASGEFVTPYGLLPIVCTYEDDVGPEILMDTTVEFSDGTTETVTVYNPDGWPCFWQQSGIDAVIGSSARTLLSTTAIGAMTAAVTLPALSAGLGPSSNPDLDSWAYDAAAGSISIDPITDAQLLQFMVLNTDPITYNVGTIVSFGNPVVLPTWVNDFVRNDSPRTMLMMPGARRRRQLRADLEGIRLLGADYGFPARRFSRAIVVLTETHAMQKKRKINRWDRRRSKGRLRRLKETEEYQKIAGTLDRVDIKLPELTDKQKQGIESDLLKKEDS